MCQNELVRPHNEPVYPGVKAHLTLIKARGVGRGALSLTPGWPGHYPLAVAPLALRDSPFTVPLHCANPLYPRLPDTGLIWMKIIFVGFRSVADGSPLPCTWERGGFVNTVSVKSAPCLSITDSPRCSGLQGLSCHHA